MTLAENSTLWMEAGQEAELLVAAQSRDPAAFQGLARFYDRGVYRLCFAMTRSPEQAASLTVSAFERAWQGIADLPNHRRFFPWVLRVARNLAASRARAEAPAGTGDALLDALGDLRPDEQMAISLTTANRLPYSEIAAVLEFPAGAAIVRISNARGFLLARAGPPKSSDGVIHLTIQQLSAYLDGELVPTSAEIVRRHLGKCEDCTLRFAALEEQDEALAAALAVEPGGDVFARIEAAVPAPRARATRATREEPAREPQEPAREVATDRAKGAKRFAWIVGIVLALLIASTCVVAVRPGAIFRGARSMPVTKAPEPEKAAASPAVPAPAEPPVPKPAPVPVAAKPAAVAPAPTSAPAPAAKSVAKEPSPKPPPPVASARPVKASTKNGGGTAKPGEELGSLAGGPVKDLVPIVRTRTVVETLASKEPMPVAAAAVPARPEAAAPPDEFAGLSPGLLPPVRAAERRLQDAANNPSAAAFDAAAVEWERVLGLLRGTPQASAARGRVADARFNAWQLEPNAYRASAAKAALRSFLMLGQPGPAREEARERLQQLEH